MREREKKSNFKKEKTLLSYKENNENMHLICVKKTK